jgi:hypothetical protein
MPDSAWYSANSRPRQNAPGARDSLDPNPYKASGSNENNGGTTGSSGSRVTSRIATTKEMMAIFMPAISINRAEKNQWQRPKKPREVDPNHMCIFVLHKRA